MLASENLLTGISHDQICDMSKFSDELKLLSLQVGKLLLDRFCFCEILQNEEHSKPSYPDIKVEACSLSHKTDVTKSSECNSNLKLQLSKEGDVISVDSKSCIDINSEPSECCIKNTVNVTCHQSKIKINLNIDPLDCDDEPDSLPCDGGQTTKQRVRRDVQCKNFVRTVRKFYLKSFRHYVDTNCKKFKSKPSSSQVHQNIEDYCKLTFKGEKRVSNLALYLFCMIDEDTFNIWKKCTDKISSKCMAVVKEIMKCYDKFSMGSFNTISKARFFKVLVLNMGPSYYEKLVELID